MKEEEEEKDEAAVAAAVRPSVPPFLLPSLPPSIRPHVRRRTSLRASPRFLPLPSSACFQCFLPCSFLTDPDRRDASPFAGGFRPPLLLRDRGQFRAANKNNVYKQNRG